ncbi:MAG: cytochrome c3 family protein [Desulfohalobiaceae bacterium]
MEADRAPVPFPHLQHSMDYGCGDCHHEWNRQERNLPQTCISCHDEFETTHGEASYFGAFHSRQKQWSCVGCHTGLGEDSDAPLTCPACHQE